VKYGSGSGFSAPRDFNRSNACMNENHHALTGVWREVHSGAGVTSTGAGRE
jgi:hypothetical protein